MSIVEDASTFILWRQKQAPLEAQVQLADPSAKMKPTILFKKGIAVEDRR